MKLKKIITLLLTGSLLSTAVYAADIPIYVKGQEVETFDAAAYIAPTQKTMIPIRAVGEMLGLSVHWQTPNVILSGRSVETGEIVTAIMNTKTSVIHLGHKKLYDAIELKEARSYVPLRVLAETFGYDVDWKNKCVYIDIPSESQKPSKPETKPEAKPETKPETKPEAKPETKPETKPEAKPEIKPEVKPEPEVQKGGVAQKVLELVNKERAKSGRSPLKLDESLSKVASIKSTDMRTNKYFSHTSPTYGSPFDMLEQFNIHFTAAGENIAQGYTSAEAVVSGWMNSPGHRENIMNSSYTHMGIGYDSNGHYWTQIFIKK